VHCGDLILRVLDYIVTSPFGYLLDCGFCNFYCGYFKLVCDVRVCVCVSFVLCVNFGYMCACIYFVLNYLYCVFLLIPLCRCSLTCFVRTATE
jgi:hypothetical protein